MIATPQSRLPLWRAFSEFFLDTEIQEHVFAYVAQEIATSGLTIEEAEAVLWNEVFPVLNDNLFSISGTWSGWSDEWLIEQISVQTYRNPKKQWKPLGGREVRVFWEKTMAAYQATHT